MLSLLDEYREKYDELPFSGHQEMYAALEKEYPDQSWWNAADCAAFLERFRPRRVVEVGGHDGGLAAAALPAAPYVESWLNLELVESPQACEDRRYRLHVLRDWAWNAPYPYDALVLSHVIEHLSERHFLRLLDSLDCRAVFVDAPLEEDTHSNWRGSLTAHVLHYSMEDVDAAFVERGFRVVHGAYANAQGVWSRTRWYER